MVNPDQYTETVPSRAYECRACNHRVETAESLGYCPKCNGPVMNVGVVRE